MSNIVEKQEFQMYPLNKSNTNSYSYYASNPLLTFEFQMNPSRQIDPSSLRLCGNMRIFNRNASNKLPANRFDENCSGALTDDEKVAYMDDRVSVSSCIQTLTIANLKGQIYEQVKEYPRMLSSLIGTTSSYKDLCSVYNNTWASYPNQDCVSRVCAGDIPFALSLRSGFLSERQPISLSNSGLRIQLNLSADNNVIYGLHGSDFVYELRDVYLSGTYMVLDKPQPPQKGAVLTYHNFINYLNTCNSNNDHNNLALNLKEVVSVYSNFVPSNWTSNFSYNGLSTPKLMNTGNVETDINKTEFMRGAVKYPLEFAIDETRQNSDGVFDTLRSRQFLNAISTYNKLSHTTISPASEGLSDLHDNRSNDYITPQSVDVKDVKKWKFTAGNRWERETSNDNIEKSARVYGVGFRADGLSVDEAQDYSKASYNFSLQSGHDAQNPNSIYTFVLAKSSVVADGMGGVVSMS